MPSESDIGYPVSYSNKKTTVKEGSSYTNTITYTGGPVPCVCMYDANGDGIAEPIPSNGDGTYTVSFAKVTGNIDFQFN